MSGSRKFLVADIGGTNTRIGLASENGLVESTTRRFSNAEHPSFEDVVSRYLEELSPGKLDGACAGAAGLVKDGVSHMTNLDWSIDRDVFQNLTKAPVVDVINDLQAQGYALDDLPKSSLKTLVSGAPQASKTRLVIGLGTGFNIVPVHQENGWLLVPSCEAGHSSAPFSSDMTELFHGVEARVGRVTLERTLAGQGLENLYEYHADERIKAGDVMGKVAAGDDTALKAFNDYITILARAIHDLGIEHLPYGGIYLTGGVSRAVSPYFERLNFAEKLEDFAEEEFRDLITGFEITLIDDDFAALKGCARYLKQLT